MGYSVWQLVHGWCFIKALGAVLMTNETIALLARVQALETAIKAAPHTEVCYEGLQDICVCWKAQALTVWQDIATAPKDGTNIILFIRSQMYGTSWQAVAKWTDLEGTGLYYDWASPLGNGKCRVDSCTSKPTHWHPLPAPPPACSGVMALARAAYECFGYDKKDEEFFNFRTKYRQAWEQLTPAEVEFLKGAECE